MQAGRLPSRLAAVGILAGVLLLGWQLSMETVVRQHRDVRERLFTERELLGRLMAAQVELSAGLAKERVSPELLASVFLPGGTEAIVFFGLQASVTAIAGSHGTRPSMTRVLPVIERNGVRLAGVHVELTASMEALQNILYTLESSQPVLMIEQLTVDPVSQSSRREGIEPGQVRAGLQVYGVLPPRKG